MTTPYSPHPVKLSQKYTNNEEDRRILLEELRRLIVISKIQTIEDIQAKRVTDLEGYRQSLKKGINIS